MLRQSAPAPSTAQRAARASNGASRATSPAPPVFQSSLGPRGFRAAVAKPPSRQQVQQNRQQTALVRRTVTAAEHGRPGTTLADVQRYGFQGTAAFESQVQGGVHRQQRMEKLINQAASGLPQATASAARQLKAMNPTPEERNYIMRETGRRGDIVMARADPLGHLGDVATSMAVGIAKGLPHYARAGLALGEQVAGGPAGAAADIAMHPSHPLDPYNRLRGNLKATTGLDVRHPLYQGPKWLAANLAMAAIPDLGPVSRLVGGAAERTLARRIISSTASEAEATRYLAHPMRQKYANLAAEFAKPGTGKGSAAEAITNFDKTNLAMAKKEGLTPAQFLDRGLSQAPRPITGLSRDLRDRQQLWQNLRRAPGGDLYDKTKGVVRTPKTFRTINGDRVQMTGDMKPQAMWKLARATTPDDQLLKDATWYEGVHPMFNAELHQDAMKWLRGWAVSQANASPEGGFNAVARVIDRLNQGEKVTNKQISTVAESIAKATREEHLPSGMAAKLHDFVDSIEGKQTRTWMGDFPHAGAPYAGDVHMIRAHGGIDPKLENQLRNPRSSTPWQKPITNFKREFGGSPTVHQYQRLLERGQEYADFLNKQRALGKDDWTPAQAQAMQWAVIQRAHGVEPSTLATTFASNVRRIATPGTSAKAIRQAIEAEGGTVSVAGKGFAHAYISPEGADRVGERLAEQHGQARAMWLSNLSKAGHREITISGKPASGLIDRLKQLGFVEIHPTPDGYTWVATKRAVSHSKFEQALADTRIAHPDATGGLVQVKDYGAKTDSNIYRAAADARPAETAAGGRGDFTGGRSGVRFTEHPQSVQSGERFLAAQRGNSRAWNFSALTPEELAQRRIFLSKDGKSGFTITKSGDLQNVFNNGKKGIGVGDDMVQAAIHHGATTLDAFDGYLPRSFYNRHGFVETGRMKFDPSQAPKNWNYARDNHPDVVFMAHGAPPGARARWFRNWENAKAAAERLGRARATPGLASGPFFGWEAGGEHGLIPSAIRRLRGKAPEMAAETAKTPVEGPKTLEQAVSEALPGAKSVRTRQEAGYSAERGRRFGAARAAREEAGGGLAGHLAGLEQMAGELPKLNFKGMDHLTGSQELDRLINQVYAHPDLTDGQAAHAAEALRQAPHGRVPTRSEIASLEKVFPRAEVDKAVALATEQGNKLQKWLDWLQFPRAIESSSDLSALMRQALPVLTRHPGLWAESIGPSLRASLTTGEGLKGALFSDAAFETHMRKLASDPAFEHAQEAGVQFTDVGHYHETPGRTEEAYGSGAAEKLPIVGHSARQYTAFLNDLRLRMWKHLLPKTEDLAVRQAAKKGIDGEETLDKAHKDLARYINSMTGRGPMPGKLSSASAVANSLLFSPRLLASRVDLLASPLTYARATPYVRRQAIRSTLQMAGAGTAVLVAASHIPGVQVGLDPRSADFGRVKIGNTRIDIWGGFQPIVRLMAQMYTGQYVSSTTGKVEPLGTKFGAQNRLSILGKFFRGKFSPNASFIADWMAGSTVTGEKFKWGKQWQRLTPMLVGDILDVLHQGGGAGAALGVWGANTLGLGVNTYGPVKAKRGSLNLGRTITPPLQGGGKIVTPPLVSP